MIIDRRAAFLDLDGTALASAFSFLATVDEAMTPGSIENLAGLEHVAVATTLAGAVRTTVGEHETQQRRGALVWLMPGAALRNEVLGAVPWRCRYVVCSGPLAQAVIKATRERGALLAAYDPAPAAWLAQLSEAVDAGLRQSRGWDWRLLRAMTALMEGLYAHPPATTREPLSEWVTRLVDGDPERPWTLGDVAQALAMSRSSLSAAWQAMGSGTLMAWVRARRLERARTLLEQGLAVGSVAEALGFSTPFAFSRAYREHHGTPPSSHRQIHLQPPLAARDARATRGRRKR